MDIINSVIPTKRSREIVSQMIPILISWAKRGVKDKTYGDLLHALGYIHYSGIGTQLGNVEVVMRELRKRTGVRDIPTLNALINSPKDGIPAHGFDFVFPNYSKLTTSEKKVFVTGLNEKVCSYSNWDWVLKELGLKEAKMFSDEQLAELRNPHLNFGGEGKEHLAIKEFLSKHPECLGYKKDVVYSEMEHILPSGDRLDLYLVLSDRTHVAIEVKPSISPEQDISRGIFQCVKYYAVMDGLRMVECEDYKIEVLLVTACSFSDQNKNLAEVPKIRKQSQWQSQLQ